jgi:hypothetical protein
VRRRRRRRWLAGWDFFVIHPFRSLAPARCVGSFQGEIGDVVVGRITEVAQKRWRVDTQSRLDSILTLASVNLPGGALVRAP